MQDDIPVQKHFLYASTIYAEGHPAEIQTVLGSCVSVCLFDTARKIGGMNHYMLPLWKGEGLATPKFGNIAIDKLLEKMLHLGSLKRNLVAKVFGGAEQLEEMSLYGIGRRNIQVATDQLAVLGIPVVGSNVGGSVGRKIVFHSSTGLVYMKFVNQKE